MYARSLSFFCPILYRDAGNACKMGALNVGVDVGDVAEAHRVTWIFPYKTPQMPGVETSRLIIGGKYARHSCAFLIG